MNKLKKCDVCRNEVSVDAWGNGKCKFCGWWQNEDCKKYPKVTNPPNFISLNLAKSRYKNGKSFLPSFRSFTKLVERGLDFSFKYKGKKYLIEKHEYYSIWQEETNFYIECKDIEDFNNIKIDQKFLKDIWIKVKNLKYEC